jgi:phytoene synthase
VGLDPEEICRAPRFRPELGLLVRRLLAEADALYRRADLGIPLLPRDARLAIAAARFIYADIGRVIERNGYDSVSARAVTTKLDKARAFARALPTLARSRAPSALDPAPEAAPLVDVVARA